MSDEQRRGPQGIQGHQGIEGEQGVPGVTSRGQTGETGASGERGIRGLTGKTGSGGFADSVVRSFLVLVVVFFIVVGVMAWQIVTTRDLSKKNTTTRVALCSLRIDLDRRIKVSAAFLRDNPKGTPGIPASVIRQSLSNTLASRKQLEILDCGSDAK